MGLWSSKLSRILSTAKHEDPDELLADIMTYERIQRGRTNISERVVTTSTPSWCTKGNRESNKINNKSIVTVSNPTMSSGARESNGPSRNDSTTTAHCWNIRMTGHTRRDCPSLHKDQP